MIKKLFTIISSDAMLLGVIMFFASLDMAVAVKAYAQAGSYVFAALYAYVAGYLQYVFWTDWRHKV